MTTEPSDAEQRTRRIDATSLNVAIIKAFGIDPQSIRKNPIILLDAHLGPIITVRMNCYDRNGNTLITPDGIADIVQQYKLVPLDPDDQPNTP